MHVFGQESRTRPPPQNRIIIIGTIIEKCDDFAKRVTLSIHLPYQLSCNVFCSTLFHPSMSIPYSLLPGQPAGEGKRRGGWRSRSRVWGIASPYSYPEVIFADRRREGRQSCFLQMRRIQLLFSEDGVAVSSSPDHRLWKGEEMEQVRSLFAVVRLKTTQRSTHGPYPAPSGEWQ